MEFATPVTQRAKLGANRCRPANSDCPIEISSDSGQSSTQSVKVVIVKPAPRIPFGIPTTKALRMAENTARSRRSRPVVTYQESVDSDSEESTGESSVQSSKDDFELESSEDENRQHGKQSRPPRQREENSKAFKHEISSETAIKRANFLIQKRDAFLPLLPPGNLVERIVERRENTGQGLCDRTVPYTRFERQPDGFAVF